MWRRRTAAIVRRMIKDSWNEEAGLFCVLHNEQPIPVVTPFNLFPLWTGQLPDHMRERLIAHLTNPDEVWREHIIPTVAHNGPHFKPETMWRGPAWVNINCCFIEALRQIGEHGLAHTLLTKTLDLVMSQPSIYEYHNPETGEPPATAVDAFGWTAAFFIDLAIQASREEGGTPRSWASGSSKTGLGLSYAIYLTRSFLGSLPKELFEPAYLDCVLLTKEVRR
ncbi:MAG: hypothetical protein PVI07_01900 [Anaerolineae bacterium]|jgi:glycogen debranching enzyme